MFSRNIVISRKFIPPIRVGLNSREKKFPKSQNSLDKKI